GAEPAGECDCDAGHHGAAPLTARGQYTVHRMNASATRIRSRPMRHGAITAAMRGYCVAGLHHARIAVALSAMVANASILRSQGRGRSGETAVAGENGGGSAVVGIGLGEDVAHMGVNSALAQEEGFPYLPVCLPRGEQTKHLHLPRGE